MLVAPLAGYLGSNFSKHDMHFFDATLAPWGPDHPAAYAFLAGRHDASTYLLLALVAGHIAIAFKHAESSAMGVFAQLRAHGDDSAKGSLDTLCW